MIGWATGSAFAPARRGGVVAPPTVAEELALGVTGERFRELATIDAEDVAPTIDAEGGVTWVLGPGERVAMHLEIGERTVADAGTADHCTFTGLRPSLSADAYYIVGGSTSRRTATVYPDLTSGDWPLVNTRFTGSCPTGFQFNAGGIDNLVGSNTRAGYINSSGATVSSNLINNAGPTYRFSSALVPGMRSLSGYLVHNLRNAGDWGKGTASDVAARQATNFTYFGPGVHRGMAFIAHHNGSSGAAEVVLCHAFLSRAVAINHSDWSPDP